MTDPTQIFELLDRLGVIYNTVEHPATFTVAEAKNLRVGLSPSGETKNLFLRDKKKRNFLLSASHTTEVDLVKLSENIGSKRLSFARPERLEQYLGIQPGSVSAFALLNDQSREVEFWLDSKLAELDEIHFHPLINTMSTTVSFAGLQKFCDYTGHKLNVVDLQATT